MISKDLNEYVETKLSKLESSTQRDDGSYECYMCHGDVYACDCPDRRSVLSTQQ